MIELRWKIHDARKDGKAPYGAIGDMDNQSLVLQYRQLIQRKSTKGIIGLTTSGWGDWKNVPVATQADND